MIENISSQTPMSWMGGRAGRGGWPGDGAGGSSRAISDISVKSKSKIFLATLGGRTAAGLYGPLLCRLMTGC